jgi:hypothetical protein
MAALYPAWSNTAYRLALLALALLVAGLVVGPMIYVRTPYNTAQFEPWDQPVEFDHRHHARDDGIECLYCHSSAETSATAGVPTTGVCMGCHVQVWNQSPLLEPVRRSYFSGAPIRWRRVHALPDFVYFNHAVHVRRGIDCQRCHGEVDRMARVMQMQPLTMGWCLDCHRSPERAAGPDPATPTPPRSAWGATVDMFTRHSTADRSITGLTTCSTCHR